MRKSTKPKLRNILKKLMACNLLEFKIINVRERLRSKAILKETNKT